MVYRLKPYQILTAKRFFARTRCLFSYIIYIPAASCTIQNHLPGDIKLLSSRPGTFAHKPCGFPYKYVYNYSWNCTWNVHTSLTTKFGLDWHLPAGYYAQLMPPLFTHPQAAKMKPLIPAPIFTTVLKKGSNTVCTVPLLCKTRGKAVNNCMHFATI